MFAVVTVQQPAATGLWGRVGRRFCPPRAKAAVATALGVNYLLLAAQPGRKDRLPWERIADQAGRMGRRLVLPPGVQPPPGSGLGAFCPSAWRLAVALCTAQAVFHRSGLPLYRRRVGLLDPSAKGLALVEPLLRYCSEVWVWSEQPEPYQALAEEMMELYGASVVLTGRAGALRSLPLLFAPYPCQPAGLESPALLLAPAGISWNGQILTDLLPAAGALPPPPPGIEASLFAGALYELGSVRRLGTLPAVTALCGGRRLTLEEIALHTARLGREGA